MPQGTSPPGMVRFPRWVPLSCATGASRASVADSSPVMLPGSGISAITMLLATGPVPEMERRKPEVFANRPSLARAAPILTSSSLIRQHGRAVHSVSALSNTAAIPGF